MPSQPDRKDSGSSKNIERLFLGLPKNAKLPQVVGAKRDWAKSMAQKVRRASGDETVGVGVARIGRPALALPHNFTDPGVDPVDEGSIEGGSSGATSTVANPGVNYNDTEPVIVVTLDTSKLSEVPDWVRTLNVRVVDRPDAQVIPSSFGLTDTPPDAPQIEGNGDRGGQSTFDASIGSAATFALVAGGFGAAYWWFGPDSDSSS